jgi:hypothetical protein
MLEIHKGCWIRAGLKILSLSLRYGGGIWYKTNEDIDPLKSGAWANQTKHEAPSRSETPVPLSPVCD